MSLESTLRSTILDVPDFPKPGIVFKDITPVLASAQVFADVTDAFATWIQGRGITTLVGIESRGFLFGAALAQRAGLGLTLVRKPGKLPRATVSQSYELEYGTDSLHLHADALTASDRVAIIDDVLATGGTAAATAALVESTGATVDSLLFLMELDFLDGRARLGDRDVYSLVHFR